MKLKESIKNWTHDEVLEAAADALDIPRSLFEDARGRYEAIGNWLDREGSSLAQYSPRISPQGSFLLGTVIRPLSDGDEYDVDLVCRLEASKADFTQKQLKDAVGVELEAYVKANNMKKPLEPGRRCWTLNYADGARFHMDVLPAVPDADTYKRRLAEHGHYGLGAMGELVDNALAITDNTLPQYEMQTDDWPVSNPFGYAAWFRSRMADQLNARKKLLKERQRITASVDQIPDSQVKTPLQRAVQLLKRHRDFMFADDPDDKPISIIISTLAARAYQNEGSLSEALGNILMNMAEFIEVRDGVVWVENPVNPYPMENFADKWEEVPKRRENFYRWLEAAQSEFGAYIRGSMAKNMPVELRKRLGESLMEDVLGTAAMATGAPTIQTGGKTGLERAEAAARKINERGGAQSRPWAMYDESKKGSR